MSSERGNVIVISAASGSGKTTLVNRLIQDVDGLERAVTCTTRAPRGAEVDGVDYYFLSVEEFERRIGAGDFLEYAHVHGSSYYGTSRSLVEAKLEAGIDVVLVIDVQGAESIRAMMPDAVTIFVVPPSFDELVRRLRGRAVDENHNDGEDITRRLHHAFGEVRRMYEFDYVVVNDDLEEAISRLESIVRAERCRVRSQSVRLASILNTFGGDKAHA
jgi:guanylate kinase